MTGYKDNSIFPYMDELKPYIKQMQEEVRRFEEGKLLDSILLQTRHRLKSYSIYNTKGWNLFFFINQKMTTEKFTSKYFLRFFMKLKFKELLQGARLMKLLHSDIFPETTKILLDFAGRHKENITNIFIFRLGTDALLPLHTNYDPHTYRAHMGLVVPEGELGMMVAGEKTRWVEGEYFIFDAMQPHTVWNYSGKPRYVISVDFYRPEAPPRDKILIHKILVKLRMREHPVTFGNSGGRSTLNAYEREMYMSEFEKKGLKTKDITNDL